MLGVRDDGTYLTVLIKPSVRGRRRERLLAAARDGLDLTDINTVPDAFDERGLPVAHLARVIEYDVPDRVGNGTGELIVLLSTITDPADARADELATAYNERWEHETANDQLKTHPALALAPCLSVSEPIPLPGSAVCGDDDVGQLARFRTSNQGEHLR